MTESNHERWSEDVAAYMLGALEPDEAAALERHAEGCERCRAEIRWLTPAVRRAAGERRAAGAAARAARAGHGRGAAATPRRETRPPRSRPRPGSSAAPPTGCAELGLRADGPAAGGRLRRRGAGRRRRRRLRGRRRASAPTKAVKTSTVVDRQAPGRHREDGQRGRQRHPAPRQRQAAPDDRVLEAWVQRDGEVEPVEALFVPDRKGKASTELPDMDGVEVVMVTTEPRRRQQVADLGSRSSRFRSPSRDESRGRRCLAAVAVRREDQLLRDRRPRRRRRVGADRDGLGDAAADLVLAVGGGDCDPVLVGALELALEARGAAPPPSGSAAAPRPRSRSAGR